MIHLRQHLDLSLTCYGPSCPIIQASVLLPEIGNAGSVCNGYPSNEVANESTSCCSSSCTNGFCLQGGVHRSKMCREVIDVSFKLVCRSYGNFPIPRSFVCTPVSPVGSLLIIPPFALVCWLTVEERDGGGHSFFADS